MRGKDWTILLLALLTVFFLVKTGVLEEVLGLEEVLDLRLDRGKVVALSQLPRTALGNSQPPRVVLGSSIGETEKLVKSYGTREGAVAYARKYWDRTTGCGYSYRQDGGDCAHFISHCLIAGGLDNRGQGKGWKENEKIIVGCPQLYRWLVPQHGIVVGSVSELEPGDVIFYGSGPEHVALYIGNGKIAEHSPSSWGKHYRKDYRKVTLVHVRYP